MHSNLCSIFILIYCFGNSRLWRHFEPLLISVGIDVRIIYIDAVVIFFNEGFVSQVIDIVVWDVNAVKLWKLGGAAHKNYNFLRWFGIYSDSF